MATTISSPTTCIIFLPIIILSSFYPTKTLSATVLEDLKNLHKPQDFNTTIINNCIRNPSLRYCNSSPMMDLDEIFKHTIVASHLCNESNNPNCVESFPKIDLRNRPNIAPLYLSFTFFWKYCPLTILSIDFSNNSIKGSFPNDVFFCTQIQSLDLSINEFSGEIPIQSFSTLTNLTFLNLSYNSFSESEISDSQFFKKFNSSSFLHSGALIDHKKFTIKAIILLVGFPILVILLVIFLGWLCFQRPDYLPRILQRSGRYKFTPAILKAATFGFSNKNLIGKSEFVHIYKGVLRDGTKVKIEMYWDDISRESYHEFVEECKILCELSHKNLVKVLGWCKGRKFRAVVTEWIREESVEMWLLELGPSWKHRVKVLMGVVECMLYLHEEWPEVDYDLKINSVLLYDNLEPLISRFQVGDRSNSRKKICKFGVFLLEMILNKSVQEDFDGNDTGFISYMRALHPPDMQKMIDERMDVTETALHHVKQVLSLGLMCIDQSNTEKLPSFAHLYNIISKANKDSLVLPSANHKTTHGDRVKGHKRVQFK